VDPILQKHLKQVPTSNRESFAAQLHIDAAVKQQPNRGWLFVAIPAALAAVGLPLYWAFAAKADKKPGESATRIERAAAQGRSAELSPAAPSGAPARSGFEASGYLVAARSATVTPEVGGRIVEFPINEGDFVRAGQVIARLSDEPARDTTALRQSELKSEIAAVDENKADLHNAEVQFERNEQLIRQHFVSQAALDNDRATLTRLESHAEYLSTRVEVARRNLKIAATAAEKYTIVAPLSGIVSKKSAQVGEYISPASYANVALCTIVDRDSMIADVSVSEINIGKVHPGQRVDAVLNAYPDVTFKAKVIEVFPVADKQSGAIRVEVQFDSIDARMRPDMSVRATFLPE
jgi:HlyD family secretion protein